MLLQIAEFPLSHGWIIFISIDYLSIYLSIYAFTLESSLDSKEIQPVNPKGNQPWIFIGRTYAEVQYFAHLMWRANSLEKTLMLAKIEDWRRRGRQRMRWLDGIPDSMDVNWSKLWEMVKHSTGLCRAGHNLAREQQRQHMAHYLLVTLSGSLSALWLMLQWARQCRDLSETLTVCPVGLVIGIRGDWFQNQRGYQHLKML